MNQYRYMQIQQAGIFSFKQFDQNNTLCMVRIKMSSTFLNRVFTILSSKSILILEMKNVNKLRKMSSGKLNGKIYMKITETSDKPPKTKFIVINGVIEQPFIL